MTTTAKELNTPITYFAEREAHAIMRALLLEDVANGYSPQEALRRQLRKTPADIAPWHALTDAVDACRLGMLRAVIEFIISPAFDDSGEMSNQFVC